MLTIPVGLGQCSCRERAGCLRELPEDGSATFGCAESLDREADQFTDATWHSASALPSPCSAIAGQRQFLPAKFCVKIAAGQLKQRIRRVFFG